MMEPSVLNAGGSDHVMGPPNLCTLSRGRSEYSLSQNRMYFSAVYIDRPTEITHLIAGQTQGAAEVLTVMRAGVFHVGGPSGNNWSVGDW